MSNSPLVSHINISPNRNSPRNHVIDTITIHCVVGQHSVEQIGLGFAPTSRGASSNYGIGYDGRIGMYVEEKDRSWCSSSPENDNRAITIEVASDTKYPYAVNDTAYKALINLLTDICQRNNIKELKWKADKSLIGQPDRQNMTVHRWFAPTECPGEYLYSRQGQIASEVNSRLGKTEEKEPTKTTGSIKVNDIVSIASNAKYYNGSTIPSWVLNKQWVVKEVNGDRIVIDKSADGKNSIMSPINSKYLTVVSSKVTQSDGGNVDFEAGDLVYFTDNVKYYNGADIPSWVKNKKWYIKSIAGDRAVIGKSYDGKNEIDSPVNVKYLRLVEAKSNVPYTVEVEISNLNIRNGPGTNYSKTGLVTGKGLFTIVEVSNGNGSNTGWGRLKSGAGWISLDYTKRV